MLELTITVQFVLYNKSETMVWLDILDEPFVNQPCHEELSLFTGFFRGAYKLYTRQQVDEACLLDKATGCHCVPLQPSSCQRLTTNNIIDG